MGNAIVVEWAKGKSDRRDRPRFGGGDRGDRRGGFGGRGGGGRGGFGDRRGGGGRGGSSKYKFLLNAFKFEFFLTKRCSKRRW